MSTVHRDSGTLYFVILFALMGLVLLMAVRNVAATDVSGMINHDTTWTKDGSPYIVTSEISLDYATLTIEPGVQVRIYYDGVIIATHGKIMADGTVEEPISFLPNVTDAKYQYIWCDGGDVFRNCTFEGGQTGLILKSDSVLTDCTFSHMYEGVAIDQGAYGVTLRDCIAHDCDDGVKTRGSGGLLFYNVSVWSCTHGFSFQTPGYECKDIVLEGCHVSGCTEMGLYIGPYQDVRVLNSTVAGGRYGILHTDPVSTAYVSTKVSGCSEVGLYLHVACPIATAPVMVKGCTFTDCPVGIKAETYGPIHMTECTFRDISDKALWIGNTATVPVLIWENDFMQGGEAVGIMDGTVPGGIVFYKNQRGNFWLSYTGTDGDGNGIGDTPKVVSGTYIDSYPLMRPHDKAVPVAEAGPDLVVDQHETFFLDGSHSTDDTFIANWTWEIDLFTSKTTLYGKLARGALDVVGHFVTTLTVRDPAGHTAEDRLNITVMDADAPEIVSHTPPGTATTGDPLVFSFALVDNVGVKEGLVIYKLTASGETGAVNLTYKGGIVWECAIPMPASYLGPVQYSLLVKDARGNQLRRDFGTIPCVDNDPPVVVPRIRKNATTGDDASIFCMVSDNIQLIDVWMEVDLGNGTPVMKAMGREGAGWSAIIAIPIDAPPTVHLRFKATDSAGNWRWTDPYDLRVMDDVPPSIPSVTGGPTALKGMEITFGAVVTDNRKVERVFLNYSIERGVVQSIQMDGDGGSYHASILVPRDAVGPLLYFITAIDADGNIGASAGRTVELLNEPPRVSTVPAWQVREGDEATLDLSGYITDQNDGPGALTVHVSADGITVQGLVLHALFDDWRPDQRIGLDVTDGENTTLFTLMVHIINTNDPPVIDAIVSPANGTVVHEGEVLVFNVSVSDPDMALGQVLQITWSADDSDWHRSMTSTMGFAFNTTDLPVGTHRIKVTVDDGEANATAWVDVIVKAKEAGHGGLLGDPTGTLAAITAVVLLLAAHFRRRRA